MKNLAPNIYRQRLVVELIPKHAVNNLQIEDYLTRLSDEIGMITLIKPVTHKSDKYGWSGWIHWETSGAHFYAWESPQLFLSVDIYTCKPFETKQAVEFTKQYFDSDSVEYKNF